MRARMHHRALMMWARAVAALRALGPLEAIVDRRSNRAVDLDQSIDP